MVAGLVGRVSTQTFVFYPSLYRRLLGRSLGWLGSIRSTWPTIMAEAIKYITVMSKQRLIITATMQQISLAFLFILEFEGD